METWDNSKPLVSVYIVAYNHEKYIARAIESVLAQKTSFQYEIIIGDDVSTDGTRKIIEKYANENPGKLQTVFPLENTYRTSNPLSKRLRSMCVGKYIICLEGDDYWISDRKLEVQAIFLEKHKDYVGIAHRCEVVDENGNATGEKYPECHDAEYTISHWFSLILPGQTTTFMKLNPVYLSDLDTSLFNKGLIPGDGLSALVYVMYGKIFCLDEVMSAYRKVTDCGSSFSATYKYNADYVEKYCSAIVDYVYKHGNEKDVFNVELYYYREAVVRGVRARQMPFTELFKTKYHRNGRIKIFFNYCLIYFKRHILKLDIYQ